MRYNKNCLQNAKYYSNLLKNKRKLLLFDDYTEDSGLFITELIRTNIDDKKPMIILTHMGKTLTDTIDILKFGAIISPTFDDINAAKIEDNSNKVFVFDAADKYYQSTFEMAMLLNSVLTQKGDQPIVIINAFEKLFDGSIKEEMTGYVKELIFDNITDKQILALISDENYVDSSVGKDIQDAFYNLEEYVNCIFTSTGFLADDRGVNPHRLNALIDLIAQTSKTVPSKTRAISTLTNLEYNDEKQLRDGIMVDMDTGLISEFAI